MSNQTKVTKQEIAEEEIRERRKPVDYSTVEYPIEILVQKFLDGEDEDTNEIFIPDYQREEAWDEKHQSKFIESIFLGLPLPYIYVADIKSEDDNYDGRLEIIDGTQRIRTLSKFINNQLKLVNLEKLKSLNNFYFKDFLPSRQRRFKRATIRMIQLTEKADEEVRRDLFERINTGSVELNEMEKRRGIKQGPLLDLIEELSEDKTFLDLCSFSEANTKRKDPNEFILRFFAFLHNYEKFPGKGKVHDFLNNYLEECNEYLRNQPESERNNEIQKMRDEFKLTLSFIEQYFPESLRTGKKIKRPITRIKFESISVGIAIALKERDHLIPASVHFIESQEFKEYTKGDASSSNNKVRKRIEYVKNQILGTS
ncbi:MAG: DUF262 domain-containing protein [Cyanobacteria bacterium]|jgi:uncharacterized protein with ParB-like and HNH nuclease domain|nr:DUF262 domain-containing protein [Cyanobacteria bacterium GSL.Bin1]